MDILHRKVDHRSRTYQMNCIRSTLLLLSFSLRIQCENLLIMIAIDSTQHFLELSPTSTNLEVSSAAQSFCSSKLNEAPISTQQLCTEQVTTLFRSQQEARMELSVNGSGPWFPSRVNDPIVPQPILTNNVIVLDHFFQDPYAVREFALSQSFNQDQKNSKSYLNPGQKFRRTKAFNSDPAFVPLRKTIERVLGKSTINWEFPSSQNVNFQLAYNNPGEYDSHCVHVDGSKYGGILYLSPAPPSSTGTKFMRHKQSQCDTLSCCTNHSINCLEDKYNTKKWETIQVVDNVFNRLVLFDAKKFHRSSGYFGTTKQNGRLFMNFFFELDPRPRISSPYLPVVRSESLQSLSAVSTTVAEQYERLPYPYNGHRFLDSVIGCSLAELNHFLYGGRRKFSETGLNILVAGGGAGGGSVVLALMLRKHNVSGIVVHLDLSSHSIRLARERAISHNVSNVRYVQGSLLNVHEDFAVMQHAPNGFDLIVSTGVLHHLEAPSDGLRSLGKALGKNGGMFVMVYGLYGRTGVYPIQDALKVLTPMEGMEYKERIEIARNIVNAIPADHPIHNGLNGGYDLHIDNDDAPFYDLLLHSRDRPFTVESVLDIAQEAGNVQVIDFVHSAKYNPLRRLKPFQGLDPFVNRLNRFQRYGVGERLSGRIGKHYFYLTRSDDDRTLEEIHVGRRIDMIRNNSALTDFWFSSEGKNAKVCPTGKTTTWKLLVDALQATLMKKILTTKTYSGWTVPWSITGKENAKYYFDISPLTAEIATLTSECTRTVNEVYAQLKSNMSRKTNAINIEKDIFALQLTNYIDWGESLLSITVKFDGNDARWEVPNKKKDDDKVKQDYQTPALEPTAVTGKMLSTSPRILQYQNLLLTKETSFLINSARKRMTTSPHGKGIYTGKKQGDGPHRTSTAGFLTPRQEASLLGKSIMKKLFAASTHPSTHAEVLQIQQYQVGGKYSCHFDPFWDNDKSAMIDPDLLLGGQRIKTLITYLYDTPLGGETVFPYASKLSTTTRSSRLDFKEIGIDEVCKNNYEQDKTLLVQKPIQGTSLLFHHYRPNGRAFDLRSWHCSCPVRPSNNNADSEDTKWIAQLWLRGESLVMYRDPSLIAMWSIDDEILNALGFESICPSSTNACPHNGRLTFEKGSEGRYKRKTNGLRQFYVFMPGSTMLISEPNIFATVLQTRSVSVVVSLQLPATLSTKTGTPLLTVQDRTSKFFLDFNDIDASHTQSRRIFTLLLSLDFTNEKEIVMVGKVGSFGTEGADLETMNVSIQHSRGVSFEKFDWKNARLVIGNSDLNVPLALTEVLTFDRIFSLKEMETILTLPTTEMLGWDKNELG